MRPISRRLNAPGRISDLKESSFSADEVFHLINLSSMLVLFCCLGRYCFFCFCLALGILIVKGIIITYRYYFYIYMCVYFIYNFYYFYDIINIMFIIIIIISFVIIFNIDHI